MATLKLKKTGAAKTPRASRPPVRGIGSAPRKRPTLAEAQAERAARAAARPAAPPAAKSLAEPPAARSHAKRPAANPPGRPAPPKLAPARPHVPSAPRPQPRPKPHAPEADAAGSVRLSKRMSELGLASRREADEWIANGWVRVDGRVVSELGSRVRPEQQITIDPQARQQQAQRVTVLINKPIGFVSGQAEDGYEPAVVLVTPRNQWREDRSGVRFLPSHLRGLAPAGRLDIDSVGLLVLTQDGRVARQLIGEDSEIEKEYLVRVQPVDAARPLSEEGLALLNHGLELEGEPLRPARVEWVNADQLRFVLKEGKKRQIRRMCEAVGLAVVGLKRVRIGAVMLGDLPPGQWRYLRHDERFA
ncbi:MAG TPA: pseudouridine synthase [Albitalea sp.]